MVGMEGPLVDISADGQGNAGIGQCSSRSQHLSQVLIMVGLNDEMYIPANLEAGSDTDNQGGVIYPGGSIVFQHGGIYQYLGLDEVL